MVILAQPSGRWMAGLGRREGAKLERPDYGGMRLGISGTAQEDVRPLGLNCLVVRLPASTNPRQMHRLC